ncbi:multicopper oxidase domain-containing protein [Geobacter sp. AOG2]|uniref:multicopper oxidase domain-containing protein n=1 Tax=Geobacter sp. AOG2 TaxID=1566347 RepID=UPI001CC58385|nr:multicopper oxidase domain-containing protein [Geobacter sp. AOG2]GFE60545.1 hypothetical protein AOG2_11330 [Geobacter sp. AOG2]
MKIDFRKVSAYLVVLLFISAVPALCFVQYGTGTKDTRDHFGATDGFIKMPDGRDIYVFGFTNISSHVHFNNHSTSNAILGKTHADFPAPTLDMMEGNHHYLSLSTLGMAMRPDLFDPHTVHFHGFPQATAFYDGEPMSTIAVNQGSDFTYFYQLNDPGTYMYHCHNEATEHMEMGMLGNLVVRPQQDVNRTGLTCTDGRPATGPGSYKGFDYDDGDCSTGYDQELIVQFADIDPKFHDADSFAQPLDFAGFEARYFMLNGRGYPDTVDNGVILNSVDQYLDQAPYPAQKIPSLITATVGQKILVRLSNLSIQEFCTIEVLGLPMRVVARDAKFLRRPNGRDLSYAANSVFIGGGESIDFIIDTTGAAPGTYYMYSRNLEQLSADQMDRSGAMTEIRINP